MHWVYSTRSCGSRVLVSTDAGSFEHCQSGSRNGVHATRCMRCVRGHPYTRTDCHTHACKHTDKLERTCTHARTLERAHTHVHTNARARARAHTHTHTQVLEVVGKLEGEALELVTRLHERWGALTLKIDFGLCDAVVAGVATPAVSLGMSVDGEEIMQESKIKVMSCVPGILTRLAVSNEALGRAAAAGRMRQRASESNQQLVSLQRRLMVLSEAQRSRREGLERDKSVPHDWIAAASDAAPASSSAAPTPAGEAQSRQPLSGGSLSGAWKVGDVDAGSGNKTKHGAQADKDVGSDAASEAVERSAHSSPHAQLRGPGGDVRMVSCSADSALGSSRATWKRCKRLGTHIGVMVHSLVLTWVVFAVLASSMTHIKHQLSASSQMEEASHWPWWWERKGERIARVPALALFFTHSPLNVSEGDGHQITWQRLELWHQPGLSLPEAPVPAGSPSNTTTRTKRITPRPHFDWPSLLAWEVQRQTTATALAMEAAKLVEVSQAPPVIDALASKVLAGDSLALGLLATPFDAVVQAGEAKDGKSRPRLPTAIKGEFRFYSFGALGGSEWWESAPSSPRLSSSYLWHQQESTTVDGHQGSATQGVVRSRVPRSAAQRPSILLLSLSGLALSVWSILRALDGPGQGSTVGQRVLHLLHAGLSTLCFASIFASAFWASHTHTRWWNLHDGVCQRQGLAKAADLCQGATMLKAGGALRALAWYHDALVHMLPAPHAADAAPATSSAHPERADADAPGQVSDLVMYKSVCLMALAFVLLSVVHIIAVVVLLQRAHARACASTHTFALVAGGVFCWVAALAQDAVARQRILDSLPPA